MVTAAYHAPGQLRAILLWGMARDQKMNGSYLQRYFKRKNVGVIFVTHSIDQVCAISDSVTVLRNGRLAGDFATSSLPRIGLIKAMMDRNVADIERRSTVRPGGSASARRWRYRSRSRP